MYETYRARVRRTTVTFDFAAVGDPGHRLRQVSLVVRPIPSYAQRLASRELGSTSAVTDPKQTLLCTYLSGARRQRPFG